MLLFKFCKKTDIKKLMIFLNENWQRKYIFSKNFKLIKWQHYSKNEKIYNFVLAIINSNIVGCLGFIKNSIYSNSLSKIDTVWLVNWLVIKKSSVSGLELIKFIIKKINFKTIGTVGGNDKTHKILKALSFKTGLLKHFYIINPKIKKFHLVKISKNKIKQLNLFSKGHKILEPIDKKLNFKIFGKNLNKLVSRFGKDQKYFVNRYVNHPYYSYKMYNIYSLNKLIGIIVTRICYYKKKKALRIVDFFGYDKALINISEPLKKLLIEINAEYVDFYEYAIDNKVMSKSGMNENYCNKKIIIPNHFEPFKKKNIVIRWAYKSKNNFVTPIFKGDCDQDRPSII